MLGKDIIICHVQICISGDTAPCMELDSSKETVGSWEEDWDPLLPPLVDNDQPAYFLYRLVSVPKKTSINSTQKNLKILYGFSMTTIFLILKDRQFV